METLLGTLILCLIGAIIVTFILRELFANDPETQHQDKNWNNDVQDVKNIFSKGLDND